jgi:hypothetical protein
MALLDSEIQRIRAELGYNVLTVSAEPYIGHVSLFEQIIQPYTQHGASTTSSTAVTAAYEFTPVTLSLTSPTGFNIGDRVVIDIDDRQEIVTAQNLVGSNLTVLLMKAHTGTYPVTVEGGESIIREILGHIRRTKAKMSESFGIGSLKQVDEIQFYQAGSGQTYFGILGNELSYWRDELASALGIRSRWGARQGAGSTCSVY